MKWSPQQDEALVRVGDWLKQRRGPQTFYLAGYAGTGKTTLAKHLSESAGKVVFGAFTGKAALVLQGKGCPGASTIHSLIYRLRDKSAAIPEWVINHDSAVAHSDLVVIDECSMVGDDLGRDLLSFGKKVLVLGDPAQLPPVRGEGFFTAGQPDFVLTEVHRQAAENPIIAMSMKVRMGGRLELGTYGASRVITRKEVDADLVLGADQVLVGMNKTRRTYNARLRQLKGFEKRFFDRTDRVVCLRNNSSKGLLNGSIWNVDKVIRQDDAETTMNVSPLDVGMGTTPVQVNVPHNFVLGTEKDLDWRARRGIDEFDFGYALTVHKSQGSQWDRVVVFDEGATFREMSDRWRYTAITRAADNVTVVM